MSRVPIRNMKGEAVGEFDLPDALLVHDRGAQALHDAMVAHQAALRAGSASTLTKGEVAGSGKKPYRQKGTGRSRAGYLRSPIRRGGGVAHGPKPRSYVKRLTKKTARLAFRRALSDKVAAGELVVLDEVALPEPRTRYVATLHRAMGSPRSLLVVVPEANDELHRAARNHPAVSITSAAQVGVYALLRHAMVAVTREAMTGLEQRMQAPVRRGA